MAISEKDAINKTVDVLIKCCFDDKSLDNPEMKNKTRDIYDFIRTKKMCCRNSLTKSFMNQKEFFKDNEITRQGWVRRWMANGAQQSDFDRYEKKKTVTRENLRAWNKLRVSKAKRNWFINALPLKEQVANLAELVGFVGITFNSGFPKKVVTTYNQIIKNGGGYEYRLPKQMTSLLDVLLKKLEK